GDFQNWLNKIDIKNMKEAFISFRRPHIEPMKKLTNEDKKLADNILEFTKNWEELTGYLFRKTDKEKAKFIIDRILYLGYEVVEKMFKTEKSKKKPNAYRLLFITMAGRKDDDIDWGY
ncbi:unnamed protein product, partial [marine sediment metagenome]